MNQTNIKEALTIIQSSIDVPLMDCINVANMILDYALPNFIVRLSLGLKIYEFHIDHFMKVWNKKRKCIDDIIKSGLCVVQVIKCQTRNDENSKVVLQSQKGVENSIISDDLLTFLMYISK
jgi:hypothetical protein